MAAEPQPRSGHSGWRKALLPAFLLVQACLLFFQLDLLDAWGDELFTLHVIRSSWVDLVAAVQKDIHPPLYFAAAKLWTGLGWPNELVVQTRALSALFCLLSTILIDRLWLRQSPLPTRLWFLALWVLSPALLLYARMARSYSLQLAAAVVALYSARRFIEKPQLPRNALFHGTACALLLYIHYLPGIAVTAATAFVLAWKGWQSRNTSQLRPLAMALGVTGLLYLPWLGTFGYAISRLPGAEPYYVASGFISEHLVRLAYWFTSFTFGESLPGWAIVPAIITAPGVVWLLFSGWRNRPPWLPLALTVAAVAYLGAAGWVGFSFMGARLLFLLPFYLLWLLCGRQQFPKIGSVVCIAMLAVSAGGTASYFQKQGFLNQGYLLPVEEIATRIFSDSPRHGALVLVDGYNTDAAPLLARLAPELTCIELRGSHGMSLAREKIETTSWSITWFFRRTHDISPGRAVGTLEAELASKYPAERSYFVLYSPLDRWTEKLLGRQSSSQHHYRLTKFQRNTAP